MRWIALLMCLATTGCNNSASLAQAREAEAKATFDAAQAKCVQETPPQVGNYSTLSRCLAPAYQARFAARNLPADLTEVWLASQAVIAGQTDRGEISVDEAKLRVAQLNSNLNDRGMKRRNEALAAMPPPPSMTFVNPMPVYQAPVFQPPVRLQTSCHRFGNTVTCN